MVDPAAMFRAEPKVDSPFQKPPSVSKKTQGEYLKRFTSIGFRSIDVVSLAKKLY